MNKIGCKCFSYNTLTVSVLIAGFRISYLKLNIKMASYEEKLAKCYEELHELEEQRSKVLVAQSWETADGQASRRVTNVSFRDLLDAIDRKKKEIRQLERLVRNDGSSLFRVGVHF